MPKTKDYYINSEGNFVFTAAYHLSRGYCCKNECKHCPWGFKKDETVIVSPFELVEPIAFIV